MVRLKTYEEITARIREKLIALEPRYDEAGRLVFRGGNYACVEKTLLEDTLNLLASLVNPRDRRQTNGLELNAQEAKILTLFLAGDSGREIAERLGCHMGSVYRTLRRIRQRAGAEDRVALIAWGIENGWY